mmetsp:Transcript_117151/g.303942  ORF Transcript_117151/g.303942 Transcript_117151/m.303942 type:complete len:1030 (+) Transcript_117151:146-3235(+)
MLPLSDPCTPWAQRPKLRVSLSTSFREAVGDPDSEAYDSELGRAGVLGFRGYFLAVLGITAAFSALSVGLWSEMGCGARCLQGLQDLEAYAGYCGLTGVLVLMLLYMFDFFCPPHLPGRYLLLWEGDRFLGRAFLALSLCCFLTSSFLIAGTYPTVPLIATIFLSPLCVLVFRWMVTPDDLLIYGAQDESDSTPGVEAELEEFGGAELENFNGFERRMAELRRLTGGQRDQKNFFTASVYAFTVVGMLCLAAFIVWASQVEADFDDGFKRREQEMKFIRWAAPVGVAVSNFMFALLMGLRVALHRTYAGTDEVRSRLVVEAASRTLGKEIMKFRMSALTRAYTMREHQPAAELSAQAWAEMKDKVEDYLLQQCNSMQKLTNIIKVLNAAVLVIFGALFIAFQFTASDSHFAVFAQGFVAALALTFGAYTVVAFSRLWGQLSSWLQDLPLWKSAAAAATRPWARGLGLVLLLPFLPGLLALIAINHCVRRIRGIERDTSTLCSRVFGRRASSVFQYMATWEWLQVIFWCYVWGICLILYKITPIFLNTLLAWMSHAMTDLSFSMILVTTFAAGMFLFMLPPVPGPPIYLFGGFVISDKCPFGFWWGTVICIVLCFVLKLTACAVQQKLIGGCLSGSMWVKRACGVHTPLMRAIERVLRKPGLSFGKVMILCGGPDWPTSVLAGILGISVFQCELGTCPIMLSIAPLSLSGSFYLRRTGYGEVWARLGNFMFILTGVVSMVFWAGMAWAIQDEFDKNNHAVTAPKEEFVDLEWLDYCAARVNERCAVQWRDAPRVVVVPYVIGMLALAVVGNLFFWRTAQCFGFFAVDGDLGQLEWFGRRGLIRPLGVIGFAVAAVSVLGLIVYKVWYARRSRQPAAEVISELSVQEADWKARRRQEAQEATRRSRLSARDSFEELSVEKVRSLRRRLSQLDSKLDLVAGGSDAELSTQQGSGSGSPGSEGLVVEGAEVNSLTGASAMMEAPEADVEKQPCVGSESSCSENKQVEPERPPRNAQPPCAVGDQVVPDPPLSL